MQKTSIELNILAKEWVENAKTLQLEVAKNGKELRERKLLDYYHKELAKDNVKVIKKKNKILAMIMKK